MARPREFDTDLVLRKVMDIFWANGYEKTSFALLEKQTGIKKASLCAAYGDKEALFLRALERYHWNLYNEMEQLCFEVSSPRRAVEKWLADAVEMSTRKHRGCFMVNSLVQTASSDPKCAKLVSLHRRKVENLLKELIQKGIKLSEFRRSLDPLIAARYLMWIVTGAQTYARNPGATALSEAKLEELILKSLI